MTTLYDVRGRMAWEYDARELAVLCEPCHADEHEARSELDLILATAGDDPALVAGIAALARGYFEATESIESSPLDIEYSRHGRAYMAGLIAGLCENAAFAELAPFVAALAGASPTPAAAGLLSALRRTPPGI